MTALALLVSALALAGCSSASNSAAGSEVTTTSSSTTTSSTTTTTLSPEQQLERDTAEITAAATAAYNAQLPIEERMTFVRDGATLVAAVYESRSRMGAQAGTLSSLISNLTFETPDKAVYRLRILSNGMQIAEQRGSAVRDGGRWVVSRATMCASLALVSVNCPPDATGFAIDESVPAPPSGGGGSGGGGGGGGSPGGGGGGGGGGPRWTVRLFTNGSPDRQGARQTGSCPPSASFTFSATSNDGLTAGGSFTVALNQTATVDLADGDSFMYGYYDSDNGQTPGTCWTNIGGNIFPG